MLCYYVIPYDYDSVQNIRMGRLVFNYLETLPEVFRVF